MEEMNSAVVWPVEIVGLEALAFPPESGTTDGNKSVGREQTHSVVDLMLTAMVNSGIQHVFGPAEYDRHSFSHALAGAQHHDFNYYGIHHEGAAAFACSAYGKLTRRPAACLANTRQGAANFQTGLRDATLDRAPVLALIETYHQDQPTEVTDVNAVGVYPPGQTAHWSRSLCQDSDPAERVLMACKSTLINRGVSQLRFSRQLLNTHHTRQTRSSKTEALLPSLKIEPPKDALTAAIKLLRASERPVIIVGQGARDRMDDVIILAEQLRAAVMTTFKGKGLMSDQHSLAGGVMGHHGTPVAEQLLKDADAILVFGANFGSDCGVVPDKPIVQIDHDLQTLARCDGVTVPVWGEIGVTAQALSDEFLGDMWTVDQTADIARYWVDWHETKLEHVSHPSSEMSPAQLFVELNEVIDDNAIIVIDAGEAMNAFGRYFRCADHSVIMPAQRETVGFAIPAAMGAWAATQEADERLRGRQVVAVCDAQGFEAHPQELAVAAEHKMDILLVILGQSDWRFKRIGTP